MPRRVVEYRQPKADATPTFTEVIGGTVALGGAALFGLSALLVAAFLLVPDYRETVGVAVAVVAAVAFSVFCGRFGIELVRGRGKNNDPSRGGF
jgi:hypothetical protein